MTVRPPGQVSLTWCPVCGRDDRYRELGSGAGHHFARGQKCPGAPQEIQYQLSRAPEPLPGPSGTFRAAVAVEIAVRPGLPHLDDGPISFVGQTVVFNASRVDEVGKLAGRVLQGIAAEIPDRVDAHPRPHPEGWMPQ
jgi:hypothetical protein